jgi:serine/threonine-protein kinase
LYRSGGLGHVWLARDTVIGRGVALKQLRPDRTDFPHSRDRFLVEARITGQLEHPGIVPLYDLIDGDGGAGELEGPCYTMRFVSGRTLAEAIHDYHARRRQGQATALELTALLDAFVSICHEVAYAHARDVLHRDLKGQNVVLGDFGEVFVLDWGLAKVLGGPEARDTPAPIRFEPEPSRAATQTGDVFGTPAFMAPELAEGQPASQTTDIYALGAILYELLTGHVTYEGDSAAEVMRKVRETDPARPRSVNPSVPPALEAVCRKAMARRPAARYGSAEELAADVRRWRADEPVWAYPDPWISRAARWARRHRTPVVGASVLLLTAVVGLAVGTGLIWREQRRTAEQKLHAEREWDRAEGNLNLVRGLALNLIDTAEKRLPAVRQVELIRKDMTDTALRTFQQLLRQRPDDAELREQTARLHRYSAKVRFNLNENDDAGQSYRESIRILEALIAEGPGERSYRDQLAEALRDYSQVLTRAGKHRDAAAVLRRSADLAAGLRASDPARPAYRRTQATALLDLSGVEHYLGRFTEEAASGREAADLFRGLLDVPRDESHPLDRMMLAMALNRLAVARRELGQTDGALTAHAESLTQIQAHLESRNDNDGQHIRGRSLFEQGRTLARLADRRPQAENDFNQAILIWDDLQRRYPQYPFYREWQAVALTARGELRAAGGRPGPAADDLERARTLLERLVKESPDVPRYRGQLGRVQADLGRLALSRGDARGAEDWLTKAVESLRAASERAPEDALERRSLDEARADLERARAGGAGRPGPAPQP